MNADLNELLSPSTGESLGGEGGKGTHSSPSGQ
ncbi:Uncharacterised protein [Vibrio cholerae]|nr:Uncharacterised protein [Vibrio cholerae]